jgi:hypothetical protein
MVLRSSMGTSRHGTYVLAGEHDLLRQRSFSRDEIRRDLRRHAAKMGFMPLLAEEFVKTEQGDFRLPIEYSFYTFGGRVALIEVKRRLSLKSYAYRTYFSPWELMQEPIWASDLYQHDKHEWRPRCLDEMLQVASRLGAAYGNTFVRVDLFATDRGCVFGEFASVPGVRTMSDYVDRLLGRLWQELCPDGL